MQEVAEELWVVFGIVLPVPVEVVVWVDGYGRVTADVVRHGHFEFLEFLAGHKVLKPGQYWLVELYLGLVLLEVRS